VGKVEAGTNLNCTLTIAEGTFPATVTFTDAAGKFTVNSKNFLSLPAVEQKLVESIKSQNQVDVKADCGGKVKLFKNVGESFECKITQPDGKTDTATATVTTLEGDVGLKY
jgi:hypothetical protein